MHKDKAILLDIFNSAPEIPWKRIAGLRDIIIHQYDFLKLEEIWRVIEMEFPKLVEQIREMLGQKEVSKE